MKPDTSIKTASTGSDPFDEILAGGTTGVVGLWHVVVTLSNVSPLGQGIQVSFYSEKIGALIGHCSQIVFPFKT